MHAIGHGNDGDETQPTAQFRGDYSELGGRMMDTVWPNRKVFKHPYCSGLSSSFNSSSLDVS